MKKPPATVDADDLAAVPEPARSRLIKIRILVRSSAPLETTEAIW